jgi:PAS domain S-box-containing protein
MIYTRSDILCQVRVFSKRTCWIAICLGALVLIWIGIFGITVVDGIVPALASMKPHATLALILSGASLVMTVGVIVMWWTATSVNQVDRRRPTAERTRDLYQHLFVHSRDSIVVMDPCGYYLEQNSQHEQLVGYTSQELIGQTPAVALGEHDFARMMDDLTRTGMYRGEAISSTKSGLRVPVDLSAFSVKDEDGLVVCHVCIERDASDRQRSEHRLS